MTSALTKIYYLVLIALMDRQNHCKTNFSSAATSAACNNPCNTDAPVVSISV